GEEEQGEGEDVEKGKKGKGSKGDESRALAETCTELSLGCLALVLEYKTRSQWQETGSVWAVLQREVAAASTCYSAPEGVVGAMGAGQGCVGSGASAIASASAGVMELPLLRRTTALLLHRMVSTPQQWDGNLLRRVVYVLGMVEERGLAGSRVDSGGGGVGGGKVDLDSPSPTPPYPRMSVDEAQVVCFCLDLASSVRRAAEGGRLRSIEWRVLRVALRVVLQCLSCATEIVADRVMLEVLAAVRYMGERWAPLSGRKFKAVLGLVLEALREVVQNPGAPEYLRTRYTALVFGIMHSFIELRHNAHQGVLSDQAGPVLEALLGIDSCNDVNQVFALAHVALRRAQVISFEEVEEVEVEVPMEEMPLTGVGGVGLEVEGMEGEGVGVEGAGAGGGEGVGGFTSESYISLTSVPSVRVSVQGRQDSSEGEGEGGGLAVQLGKLVMDGEGDTSAPASASAGVEGESAGPTLTPADTTPTVAPSPIDSIATSSIASSAGSVSSPQHAQQEQYLQWLQLREGISAERVDSERARLVRSRDTLELTSQATSKFWRKARRKVESECFQQSHQCQWKLGVAHEGHFFGRRRVVLRPRYAM
ncbi:hypothetical protein B484DRAFT_390676, partial [Ochromonadaceae sp. CCMP2298]